MATDTIKLSDAQTLRVVASSPEALELESSWTTGGRRPQTHWHPRQHELFEVLAGRLTVELDGKPPQILRPGETVDVPPRTSHSTGSRTRAGPSLVAGVPSVTHRGDVQVHRPGNVPDQGCAAALDFPTRVPARNAEAA